MQRHSKKRRKDYWQETHLIRGHEDKEFVNGLKGKQWDATARKA